LEICHEGEQNYAMKLFEIESPMDFKKPS